MIETLFSFLGNNFSIIISLFSLFLVIKRDNRSNPNIIMTFNTDRFFISHKKIHIEWAKKFNLEVYDDSIGLHASLMQKTYVCENVGVSKANWGYFYTIIFEDRQVIASRPIFSVNPSEKFSVTYTTLIKKKTSVSGLQDVFWTALEYLLKRRNYIDVDGTANIFVYSDFTNSKYIYMIQKHDLSEFKKTSGNLNFFHPLKFLLVLFCSKVSKKQKNTYEDRFNQIVGENYLMATIAMEEMETVKKITSDKEDPRFQKERKQEEKAINDSIKSYLH